LNILNPDYQGQRVKAFALKAKRLLFAFLAAITFSAIFTFFTLAYIIVGII
jgi:hypothetical protein